MNQTQIQKTLITSLKRKDFYFWTFVRILASAGPLLTTYIFARGVGALENKEPINVILSVFIILTLVKLVENTVRILSKTRVDIIIEKIQIENQDSLLRIVDHLEEGRNQVVQAVINVSRSVSAFLRYLKQNGINGIVHFFSVPVILFFIDKRIFALELLLMSIYLLVTYLTTKRYEKKYEVFDESQEYYFAKMFKSTDVDVEAGYVVRAIKLIQNFAFVYWSSLQNIIAVFQFLVIALIAFDIASGTKQISDLVLIVGYTRESQTFLNSLTSSIEKFMEVKAGVLRLAAVSASQEKS